MSASKAEVQELADEILAHLGVRMRAGQLVIHYSDGVVQRCETNTVHKAMKRRLTDLLDKPSGSSAE